VSKCLTPAGCLQEYFEAGRTSDCMALVSIFVGCDVVFTSYPLYVHSCSFVYSPQYTAGYGNFHLTVTITVFHGTLPCFIILVVPCDGNEHADYTHV
jgi:hypothetical protein